jgi:hypothetical protein
MSKSKKITKRLKGKAPVEHKAGNKKPLVGMPNLPKDWGRVK